MLGSQPKYAVNFVFVHRPKGQSWQCENSELLPLHEARAAGAL